MLLLGCRGGSESATNLVRLDFLGGRLTAQVPTGFSRNDGDSVLGRGIVGRGPATVLLNPARTVRIEVVSQAGKTPGSGFVAPLEGLLTLLKDCVRASDPSAVWLQDDVVTINDRRYLLLDFRSTTAGTTARQMVVLTRTDDLTMLMVAFACDAASEEAWIPVGRQVIDSVVVNG
jgi:hypothetical protein